MSDVKGRRIAVLDAKDYTIGMHRLEFKLPEIALGVYYLILKYDDEKITIPLIKE